MIEFFTDTLTLIAIVSFLAGVINSISGGGGVFLLPSLIAFGLPPINALVVNRVVDAGVITGALGNYWKAVSNTKLMKFIIPFSILMGVAAFFGSSAIASAEQNLQTELVVIASLFATLILLFKIIPQEQYLILMVAIIFSIGGVAGARIIVFIPENIQKVLIIAAVIIVALLIMFPPQKIFSKNKSNPKFFGYLGVVLLFLVGAWSGAFAMAGATMGVLVLVHLFNKSYVEARGLELASSVPETLISTSILYFASTVAPIHMVVSFGAAIIGAWCGSKFAVNVGEKVFKIFIAIIGISMSLKILIDFLI